MNPAIMKILEDFDEAIVKATIELGVEPPSPDQVLKVNVELDSFSLYVTTYLQALRDAVGSLAGVLDASLEQDSD